MWNVELERAHRVGLNQENRPRPIIARFVRFSDREAASKNVNKFRGTNIYVNEDLCPASQAIRKEKLPLVRRPRSEGKMAYFSHTKLIIKGKSKNAEALVEIGAATGGIICRASLAEENGSGAGAGTAAVTRNPNVIGRASLAGEE